MDNLVTAQLTSSALITYGIELVKKSKYFPSITAETKNLNRVLMVAASSLAAIGIHMQFDSSTGTLVIAGLTTVGIIHGLWELVRSSIMTQLVYDTVLSKQLNGGAPSETPK